MATVLPSKSLWPIRLACGIIALYHVAEGVAGLISGEVAARVASLAFGISLQRITPVSDQFEVIFRFVGAFALAFGIMMLLAALDPVKSRPVIIGGMVFFGTRLVTRIFEAGLLQQAFDVAPGRNLRSIVAISVFLAALVLFFPRTQKAAQPSGDST